MHEVQRKKKGSLAYYRNIFKLLKLTLQLNLGYEEQFKKTFFLLFQRVNQQFNSSTYDAVLEADKDFLV